MLKRRFLNTEASKRKLEIAKLAVVTTAAVTGLNPNTALQTATNALDHNSVMGFLRAIKKLQGGDAVDEFIDILSPGLSREYLAKDACNFVLMTRDSIMGMVDYGEQRGLSLSQMMRGNPRLDSLLGFVGQGAGLAMGTGLTVISIPGGRMGRVRPLAIKGAEGTLLLGKTKMIRHHVFNKFRGNNIKSEKYRNFFSKHSINVDEFTIEIPHTTHVNQIHRAGNNWTARWKKWIDINPNATTKEVYQFAGRLMDEYGVNHIPLVRY